MTSGTLEDSHVFKLSRRISSEEELFGLGSMGLGVKDYDINAALKDKDGIQDAAKKFCQCGSRDSPAGRKPT